MIDKKQFPDIPQKACLAPLTSVMIGAGGSYRPCCWYRDEDDPSHKDAHLKKMSIKEYREKILFPMYEEMKKGNYPTACKRCALPGRKRFDVYEPYRQYPGIDIVERSKDVRALDLRFSNLCNLGCVMCNAGSSDQFWKQEDRGLYHPESVYWFGKRKKPEGKSGWHNIPGVIESIYELLPTVDVIYMTGGEPSINPGVHKIMEHCIEKGYNKKIRLEFNTNCTNSNKKFLDLLAGFQTDLMLSIDAVGELNDIIRYPSNFPTLEKNTRAMIENQTKESRAQFAPSVHVYNFFKLHETHNWMESIKQEYPDKVKDPNWNIIFQPFYMNIGNIPENLFNEYLDKHGNELPDYLVKRLKSKRHNEKNDGYDWEKIKDEGRKWFASRKADVTITGVPGI